MGFSTLEMTILLIEVLCLVLLNNKKVCRRWLIITVNPPKYIHFLDTVYGTIQYTTYSSGLVHLYFNHFMPNPKNIGSYIHWWKWSYEIGSL